MAKKSVAQETLRVLLGDKEILVIPGNPQQYSKAGNPMPWSTRGFVRVPLNGETVSISINVLLK